MIVVIVLEMWMNEYDNYDNYEYFTVAWDKWSNKSASEEHWYTLIKTSTVWNLR